jgi:hypothetical protein
MYLYKHLFIHIRVEKENFIQLVKMKTSKSTIVYTNICMYIHTYMFI